MIGNKFYTWFKNYYQWVGGAFNETLLLPLVRATSGLRVGAIRYDEATDTVETYDGTNWNAIPSASGFVPYTGATTDVDLGNEGISAGYLKLDVSPSGTPTDQGTIYWDDSTETAALIMNGTTQHIGQDVFYYVKNSSGSQITKGTAVRFAGTDGNSGHLLITPFIADGSVPSSYFMGVTSETIDNGAFGKVMHFGELSGVNTNSFQDGDILYASTTVAGGYQTTVPTAPNNIVQIAAVVNAANNGILLVRPTLASNINTDEAVRIISPIAGQGLFYDNGLWVNKSIATVLGYTPVPPTRMITINGTAQDLSADRTYNVGTVTSVGLTSSTSGVTITSSPVTVSGNIGLAIATASGSQQGLLSSTDWTTFNAKQAALTLTTTGNSGASTLVGATLNVPEYTLSGLGGVPTSRTLSINGTSYDLTANRSWSVGTVTSVGLTTSTTGVTIGSTPVTSSGNITIDIATASGSAIGLLSSTDWTTFNNKQNALTLTTSGSSGAATLVGATLNIPQYQAAGNYITSLTGEVTASGPGSASATLTNSAVIGKVLTGLNLTGGGTIASTDSILEAFGKVQNQISAMVGGVMFQGTWNANTNTPTLASGTGTKGHYYIVDVSGTTTLDGKSDWRVGDWAIFNGTAWDKVDNTDAVSSVNGFTGAVSLSTSHINEGTNLYYTDARARAAINLTTTGNSGSATYDASGVLNVPTYTLAGLGGVASTRTLTINGTAFDLSADRSWSVGTVTSVGLSSSTSGVTIGSTPVTGSGTITIDIATASGSQNGLLSSTDWTTFNNKQNALTNPVTGIGMAGQVPYFTGGTTVQGSNVYWDATNSRMGIGVVSPTVTLDVSGTIASNNGSLGIFTSGASSRLVLQTNGTNRFDATSTETKIGDQSGTETLFVKSGNLGLGVTPSAWESFRGLQVGQVGSFASNDFGSGNIQTFVGNNVYYDNTGFKYIQNGVASMMRMTSASAAQWEVASSGTAGNAISFTQAMTLDASGRLGIGTASPSYRLHVNSGTDGISAGIAGSTYGIRFDNGGTFSSGMSTIHGVDSTLVGSYQPIMINGSDVRFGTSATERMRITSAGNVGINTTTPNGIFHTKVATNANFYLTNYVSGEVALQFTNDANTLQADAAFYANKYVFYTGNVGIGTTSPAQKLDVSGIIRASAGTIYAQASGTESSGYQLNALTIGYDATNTIGWITAGGASARTNLVLQGGGGNVGIGTTSPSVALDVVGAGKFSSTIQTGAPSGGTAAAWKLGTIASTADRQVNRYIEVEVGGNSVWIHASLPD